LTDRLRFRDCLWPAITPLKAIILIGTLLALLVLSHVLSQMTKPLKGADLAEAVAKALATPRPKETSMELLLIIVVLFLLFGGGGYFGRRRGYW